jgi:hypothetical protein
MGRSGRAGSDYVMMTFGSEESLKYFVIMMPLSDGAPEATFVRYVVVVDVIGDNSR